MAVYKRSYRPYEGALTPSWSRFLVVPRYALSELLTSRLLVAFLVLCFVPILIETAIVYLSHNATARALLGGIGNMDLVNVSFFLRVLSIQSGRNPGVRSRNITFPIRIPATISISLSALDSGPAFRRDMFTPKWRVIYRPEVALHGRASQAEIPGLRQGLTGHRGSLSSARLERGL